MKLYMLASYRLSFQCGCDPFQNTLCLRAHFHNVNCEQLFKHNHATKAQLKVRACYPAHTMPWHYIYHFQDNPNIFVRARDMLISANWRNEDTDSDTSNPASLYFDPFALKMKRFSEASAIEMKKGQEFIDGLSSGSDSDNDVPRMTPIPYEVRRSLPIIALAYTHA